MRAFRQFQEWDLRNPLVFNKQVIGENVLLLLAVVLFGLSIFNSIRLLIPNYMNKTIMIQRSISGVWESNLDEISNQFADYPMYKTVEREGGAFPLTIEFDDFRFIVTRDILFRTSFGEFWHVWDDFERTFWDSSRFTVLSEELYSDYQKIAMLLPDFSIPHENVNYCSLKYAGHMEVHMGNDDIFRAITTGTFSVLENDDMIRFELPDGSVAIHSISLCGDNLIITTGIVRPTDHIYFNRRK